MHIKDLKNHLLVATPHVGEGVFSQSVIYLYEHSSEGAMGLVINKPLGLSVKSLLNHLEIPAQDFPELSQSVLMGGPVGQEHGFILFEDEVDGDIHLSASKDLLKKISEGMGPKYFVVALGYAGWSQSQLDQEIKNNDWLVVPCYREVLFQAPMLQRWTAAAWTAGVDIHQMTALAGHA